MDGGGYFTNGCGQLMVGMGDTGIVVGWQGMTIDMQLVDIFCWFLYS